MNIFEILFYQPLYNIVVMLYHLFGDNLGLSIIAIGIISRTILIPVTMRQIKMAESSREMNEKIKEVKEKYKKDKEKQTEEMMKIQKEYLPAQLGGCLPMIFQLIVFINIYSIVRSLIESGAEGFSSIAYPFVAPITGEINYNFLGGLIDLRVSPSHAETSMIPYIILIVIVGITQYFSMKILTGIRNKQKEKTEQSSDTKKKKKKNKKNSNPGEEDFSEIMQRSTNQVMMVFPFFLMFISYGLPAGLSVYLITTSLFVILQQSIFYKIKERRELNLETNN